MRVWALTRMAKACGGCGAVVPKGGPMLELSAGNWKVQRCRMCADEPVPADIAEAPTVAHVIRVDFGNRLDGIAALAEDFKQAQGADR